MSKISVILATFNEEKNLPSCLESVKDLASEIVIVDGSSTDKTVKIANKYTDKVFVRDNPLMFHINKQRAIEKATGDWILYLDADERVSPELAKEIKEMIESVPGNVNGLWLPRKNIIFNKWIAHAGWYPDYQLRLFRRGKGFLPCKSLHEQPEVHGETLFLHMPLEHLNYQRVSQFVDKLNHLYTENDKNIFLKLNKKIHWYDALRWPVGEFLKRFFREEGYKDGLHGLVLSLLQSFSSLVTFAKIWEEKGFKEEMPASFPEKVSQELKGLAREFNYWLLTSKLSGSVSLSRKFYYKVRRKLLG